MIYKKHIISQLTQAFVLITFVVLSIVILSQFLKFIHYYIGKGFELTNILLLLLFIIPPIFVHIAPITLFCSIFFVYYKLITDRELIVLEATGINKLSLAIPAIYFATIIAVICYIITIFVTPYFNRELQNQQTLVRENFISSMLEEKIFNTLSKDLTIYIDNQQDDGSLEGVIIYDQRNKTSQAIITAQSAKLIPTKKSLLISLYNGSRQHLNQNNQLETLFFDSSDLTIEYKKFDKTEHHYSASELYIHELLFFPTDNQQLKNVFNYELHQRFSWPLLNITIAAIAICSILSVEYSRQWKYKKVIIGSSSVAAVILLDFIFVNMSENSLFFTIALYFNLIFIIWLSLYILKQKCDNKELIPLQIKQLFSKLVKLNHIK